MTPAEVNEAVARKLYPNLKEWEGYTALDGVHFSTLPNYSGDIAAAWEIVDQRFSSFHLWYDECSGTWFCKWDNQRRVLEDCRYFGEADAPSKAICLAFLALNQSQAPNTDTPL